MKKIIFTLLILLGYNLIGFSQKSHLSLIYDFEGADFDYKVIQMVGVKDSLFVIGNTPNGKGVFFKIDEHGKGYEVIWEFDNVNWAPNSIIANDTIIYGTTRFSSKNGGGGTLFQYSLKDFSFKFIKSFDAKDVQDIQVKYITDSVLWLSSSQSFIDNGSIFRINKDGTGFKKIYNDTNEEKGQNPTDFVFYDGYIYIAFANGGGEPYLDETGHYNSSGSFIRIKVDGTGYENLVKGGNNFGAHPRSLLIRENKLIGLFAYSGNIHSFGARFFRSNLDGSSYDSLGALGYRAISNMLSTDSLIYGVSLSSIYGINPFNGEKRIFEDLQSDSDFGYDVVANPAFLNGNVFFATQQGGPNSGGTILKWTNQNPQIKKNCAVDIDATTLQKTDINLFNKFTDPEEDHLTFSFEYDKESVTLSEANGILAVTPLISDQIKVRITANDGWGGYKSTTVTLNSTEADSKDKEDEFNVLIYPNPAHSILKINALGVELIEISDLNGSVIRSYRNPRIEINISSLSNGVY